jgi:hypothetical protein
MDDDAIPLARDAADPKVDPPAPDEGDAHDGRTGLPVA